MPRLTQSCYDRIKTAPPLMSTNPKSFRFTEDTNRKTSQLSDLMRLPETKVIVHAIDRLYAFETARHKRRAKEFKAIAARALL